MHSHWYFVDEDKHRYALTPGCSISTEDDKHIPKRKRSALMKNYVKRCKSNRTYFKNRRVTRKMVNDIRYKEEGDKALKALRAAQRRRIRIRDYKGDWVTITEAIRQNRGWRNLKTELINIVYMKKGKKERLTGPRWWIYGYKAGVLDRHMLLDILYQNMKKLDSRFIKILKKKTKKKKTKKRKPK